MIDWIVAKWDRMIYCLARYSLRRICHKQPAFAYLLELWLREQRRQHPLPESLENAANRFFEAMDEHGGSKR